MNGLFTFSGASRGPTGMWGEWAFPSGINTGSLFSVPGTPGGMLGMKAQHQKNMQARKDHIADSVNDGVQTITIHGSDGKVKSNGIYVSSDGAQHKLDKDGRLRIIDRKAMEDRMLVKQALEEQILDLTAMAAASDADCAMILGVSETRMRVMCGKNNDGGITDMPSHFKSVSCIPSECEMQTDRQRQHSIRKLKMLVQRFGTMPTTAPELLGLAFGVTQHAPAFGGPMPQNYAAAMKESDGPALTRNKAIDPDTGAAA